jgi:hypothetical protein
MMVMGNRVRRDGPVEVNGMLSAQLVLAHADAAFATICTGVWMNLSQASHLVPFR